MHLLTLCIEQCITLTLYHDKTLGITVVGYIDCVFLENGTRLTGTNRDIKEIREVF